MTEPIDYEPILAAIETGIDKARKNPKPEKPTASDDYTAWVVLRELHRYGWSTALRMQAVHDLAQARAHQNWADHCGHVSRDSPC